MACILDLEVWPYFGAMLAHAAQKKNFCCLKMRGSIAMETAKYQALKGLPALLVDFL
jgi:hypothetical protein